jgi:hypothetical protein
VLVSGSQPVSMIFFAVLLLWIQWIKLAEYPLAAPLVTS